MSFHSLKNKLLPVLMLGKIILSLNKKMITNAKTKQNNWWGTPKKSK